MVSMAPTVLSRRSMHGAAGVGRTVAIVGLAVVLAVGESRAQTGGTDSQFDWSGDGIEASQPPLCSRVAHVGIVGMLVDQAWQAYRRIERSSPLRVGWCACAKRCEPIDRFAASEEKVAWRAKQLSVDPTVPPDQRNEYAELSIEMFGRRNKSVNQFNDCIDRSRPPLSPPKSRVVELPDGTRQLTGKCSVDAKPLTREQLWKIWCDSYQRAFNKIAADFIEEFKEVRQIQAEVTFITRVAISGAHRTYGGSVEPKSIKDRAVVYQDRVLSTVTGLDDLLPPNAARQWYEFNTKLTTKEKINRPIDCPKS